MAPKEWHARKAIHRQGIDVPRELPDIGAGPVDWFIGLAGRRESHHFPFMRFGHKLLSPRPRLANARAGRGSPLPSPRLSSNVRDTLFVRERSELRGLTKKKRSAFQRDSHSPTIVLKPSEFSMLQVCAPGSTSSMPAPATSPVISRMTAGGVAPS
jgi:hypothetical protein